MSNIPPLTKVQLQSVTSIGERWLDLKYIIHLENTIDYWFTGIIFIVKHVRKVPSLGEAI